ncbi:MAG: leucine--tRNA ligase [Candidatus Aenigmatarchaeota archaeon]
MDYKKIEKKWQEKWKGLFDAEPGKKKAFYVTTPYPYPSGGMHVGHIRTYTVADIVARFKRMQGFNVLWPMAWHLTGTPIIGAVNRLKKREKKQMFVLKEVYKLGEKELKTLETPMGYANYFIDDFRNGMKSLGFSIDWRRQFTTNDDAYKQFVSWQHGILYKKGYQKQGLHPVKWCLEEKNPVTTHDLLEGVDAETQEFVLIKFKHGRDFIVTATLRPETMFGVTNVWVDPNVDYVRVKVKAGKGEETWIVSEPTVKKLEQQNKEPKVLEKISGKDLVGEHATIVALDKKVPILPSKFCEENVGTGIVVSVPSDAPFDYMALKDLQNSKYKKLAEGIKIIPIIKTKEFGDMAAEVVCKQMYIKDQKDPKLEEATKIVYKTGFHKGVMNQNCGEYSGMPVARAKDAIRREFVKSGAADLMYEFSEPVVCRCGSDVVVALKNSWFIDYGNKNWKRLAKEAVNNIRSVPDATRDDYIHAIDWLEMWPCVRNFGLGTPLPQDKKFIIEPLSDSTIYMSYYLIADRIKKYKPEQLTKEFFDFVMLEKGDAKTVSNKTKIPVKELKEMQTSVNYWYPMTWRASANDLIQNHLTFMLFHHAAIFPKKKWPRGIAVWGMGLLEGGKMSSSKGNVVLASDAIQKYSADATRLFLFSSVDPWQDFDWRAEEVKKYKERVGKIYEKIISMKCEGGEKLIDKWIVSEVNNVIRDSTDALELFQTRKASLNTVFKMHEVIRWYERRGGDSKKTVDYVKNVWIKLLSPFIPHTAEELWEQVGGEGFVSTSSWPKHDEKLINNRLDKMEGLVRQTLEDINQIIKLVNKKPELVKIYVPPFWKYEVYKEILEIPKGDIIQRVMKNPEVNKYGKHALRFAQQLQKSAGRLETIPTHEEEFNVLTDAKGFFEREVGCEVQILDKHTDRSEKALKADPGKPGIEIV